MFLAKNKNLVIATGLAACYSLVIYLSMQTMTPDSIFSMLSQVLMLPSIALHGLAAVLGLAALLTTRPWAAATAGGILCFCTFISPWHLLLILFEGVEIALWFSGYSDLKEWRKQLEEGALDYEEAKTRPERLTHLGSCESCGRLRQKGETFSKYGLCYACNERLRKIITDGLAFVKGIVANPAATLDQIKAALEKLEKLEALRPRAPFFKSSTNEYRTALLARLPATEKDATEEGASI